MRLRNCIVVQISLLVSLFAFTLSSVGQTNQLNRYSSPGNDVGGGSEAGISGVIVDSGDHAMSNVQVALRDVSRGNVVGTTWTNIAGQYRISNVPRGEYEITALTGLNEVHERVSVLAASTTMNLRFANLKAAEAGDPNANTVNLSEFKVPAKARKAFRKAESALPSGDYGRVSRYLAEALSIYPQYGEALTLNAFLKLQKHEFDSAREDLEKAVQYNSGYPITYFLLADSYNEGERFDDAARTAGQGIRLAPQAWQGYFEMSRASLGKSQFMEALRQASKAVELGGNFPLVHLLKGKAFVGMKDYESAIAEMKAYLNIDPNGEVSAQVRTTIDRLKELAAKTTTAPAVDSFVSTQP